jgi:hypothetical protein
MITRLLKSDAGSKAVSPAPVPSTTERAMGMERMPSRLLATVRRSAMPPLPRQAWGSIVCVCVRVREGVVVYVCRCIGLFVSWGVCVGHRAT